MLCLLILIYLSAKLGFGAADVTSIVSSIGMVLDIGLLARVLCRPNEGPNKLIGMFIKK